MGAGTSAGIRLFIPMIVVVALAGEAGGSDTPGMTWNFDADPAGKAPVGFLFARTGQGREGAWVVRAESDAPSPKNVLTQTDADATSFRFPVAVVEGISFRDVALTVRCKMVSGEVDRACGLVFRYRDPDNYHITRANALEDNIRLYHVKGGKRAQIGSFDGRVSAGVWHVYRVEARGEHITVHWNGAEVLSVTDATFPNAGGVGVWTKADSVTYFDDLTVAPLELESGLPPVRGGSP